MTLTDDNEYDPVMDPTHEFSVAENAPFGTNVGTTIVCQSEIECYPDTITYVQNAFCLLKRESKRF